MTKSITLVAKGPREVVDESKAESIISSWREEIKSAGGESSVDKIVLTNKSYTSEAASKIAEFLTSPLDDGLNNNLPVSKTIRVANLDDIIASRMEEEGLLVLKTICDAFIGSSLVEVDLSDNAMGSKGITACKTVLSGQSETLERLLLCNNGLSEFSMAEVADILTVADEDGNSICEQLTKIHFFNNMSGDGGCEAFAKIMSSCSSKLTDVRFSGTRAGRRGSLLISSALEQLGSKLSNLVRLDLADNTFGSQGGSILAKALRRCSKLKYLNLRDCVLEDDATGEICRAIWSADAPLEHLDLSGNEISRKGAKSIAELIDESTSTLKVLHCEENEMTSKGVAYIASALGSGGAIEEVKLGSNECGSIGATALVTAYGDGGDGMPNLKKIYLDENMFPEQDVNTLTEAFGDKLEEMEDNDDEGDADEDLSDDSEDEEESDDEEEDAADPDEREYTNEGKVSDSAIDKLTSAMGNVNIHDLV